jgi:hypothetical protein
MANAEVRRRNLRIAKKAYWQGHIADANVTDDPLIGAVGRAGSEIHAVRRGPVSVALGYPLEHCNAEDTDSHRCFCNL